MKKNFAISAFAILFLWLIWIVAYFAVGNDYLLPSFWETFASMGRLLGGKAFWVAFGASLLRTLLAFAVSFLFGVTFAVIARCFSPVRAFFAPIVSFLRTVPTLAVVLLLLAWLIAPSVAPVLVGMLVLFPAVYAAALASFDEVAQSYGRLATVYNVSVRRRVFQMYLPLCAPALLSQSGAILSLGLKIVVSGEVLANTYRSLGGMMQDAKMFTDIPTLLALTLVCVLAGFALEGICYGAHKLIVRWRQ